jgi:hypothetical protein
MRIGTELAVAGVGVGLAAFLVWRSGKAVGGAVSSAVGSVVSTAGDVLHAVNPTNPDNVFAGGVNAGGQAATGDRYWTLGGWIYDMTHDDAGAIATAPLPTIDFGRADPSSPSSW